MAINKKYFDELTIDEVRAIYDRVRDLQNEGFDLASDNIYYFLQNEYFSYFEHYSDYTTPRVTYTAHITDDAYGNIFVKVDDSKYVDFLTDCKRCESFYLDDQPELVKLIDRLIASGEKFNDLLAGYLDFTVDNENRFNTWYEAGINKVIRELTKQMQAEHDALYDDEYRFNTWYNVRVACDCELYISDNEPGAVFEDITRRYNAS